MNNLIKKIYKRFYWFTKIGYRYVFSKTVIKGDREATILIDENVTLSNVSIDLEKGATLKISKGTTLKDVDLYINGSTLIGENNLIYSNLPGKLRIRVVGDLFIGNNNRIQSTISIKCNGKLVIGSYTNINSGSDICVDERIEIGSFNQISFFVEIWDTNMHNIYPADQRRKLTIEKFPSFGYEFEKPKTKPIKIGDDCWIGKGVTILKGVSLGNKCVVGTKTILSNQIIEDGYTVVGISEIKKIKNNI
ncbi:MAG: DapH/DapD/GlmU-related protein [Bacteroidales bacterium]|nr:DapH/DapD/GlmU-related protein [Bacteroidales bacterium]